MLMKSSSLRKAWHCTTPNTTSPPSATRPMALRVHRASKKSPRQWVDDILTYMATHYQWSLADLIRNFVTAEPSEASGRTMTYRHQKLMEAIFEQSDVSQVLLEYLEHIDLES